MPKFTVSLDCVFHYTGNVEVEVEAANEQEAIEAAYSLDEYDWELDLEADPTPCSIHAWNVEEITAPPITEET